VLYLAEETCVRRHAREDHRQVLNLPIRGRLRARLLIRGERPLQGTSFGSHQGRTPMRNAGRVTTPDRREAALLSGNRINRSPPTFMVRRGSTVRVRQRALQKRRKSAFFVWRELARSPACGADVEGARTSWAGRNAPSLLTLAARRADATPFAARSATRACSNSGRLPVPLPRLSRRGCGGVWRSIRLSGTPSATIARLSPRSRSGAGA
jgi:hypothetical protein